MARDATHHQDAAHWRTFTAQTLSHDLRAHLRAIGGQARMLQARLGPNGPEEALQLVQKLRQATAQADQATMNLVELLRIEDAPLRIGTVDLRLLTDWAQMDVDNEAPATPLQLEIEGEAQVQGDEVLLKSLLTHLLRNVRAFGQARAQVTFNHHPEAIQIAITDAGNGVDVRDTDVFAPGTRLHGPAEGGGNGLGLNIAQRIVQLHGGRIGFESAPGLGTTVVVRLPLSPP